MIKGRFTLIPLMPEPCRHLDRCVRLELIFLEGAIKLVNDPDLQFVTRDVGLKGFHYQHKLYRGDLNLEFHCELDMLGIVTVRKEKLKLI